MKKLFFILLVVILSSCKKEEQTPSINYRIKTETNNNLTYRYSYLTTSGRIWYIYKNGYKYHSYHYESDSIIETNYDNNGVPSTITYFINKEGYIIGNSLNTAYAYDSDWHKQEPANTPNQFIYQYDNGNLMNISMNYVHDTTWFTYTYYPDKLEKRTKGLRAFLGSGNRNLLKTEHIVSTAAGTVNSEYSYEFDAKGRVSKETRLFTSSLGTTPVITDYTYFD